MVGRIERCAVAVLLASPSVAQDPATWRPMDAPVCWEESGIAELHGVDGFAWFRCVVDLPESWRGQDITLRLGSLDDADETFVNGARVGGHGAFPPDYRSATGAQRNYRLEPHVLRIGEPNLIAIRIYDGGGRGGFKSHRIGFETTREWLDLAGTWQFRAGDDSAWKDWPSPPAAFAHEYRTRSPSPPGASGPIALDASWRARVASGEPLTPEQALAAFDVLDGLTVQLAASEPEIVQPVDVTFDDRGRMWVVQYVQYMYPAGLEARSKDQWDRTVYDRIPQPPPHGPRGADRITICEDTDGDGRYDAFRDFVDGLNLATSVALGHGGVFVAQTPYLLFYPDHDRDDVPDSDPEVLLSGFGMEDAHAVVNSLTWGPDGWLYGAQGSTCTAHVRGVSFQQAAWRYHPTSRRFELFAEGGGNTFGLEFDADGELLTGTNWGNYTLVHYVQGGAFFKNFGKHGPLTNAHAYGYFLHCPHEGAAVGHVAHVGVRCRPGDALPNSLDGSWICAHLLGNRLSAHDVIRDGSSYRTRFRTDVLTTPDRWFRPVDLVTGPDGAIYVADWYDQRATHLIPKDTWHKTSGRIWRIAAPGATHVSKPDLRRRSDRELVELLAAENRWLARMARQLLAERGARDVWPELRQLVVQPGSTTTELAALWTLFACGGLERADIARWLGHPDWQVRAWVVRLACDEPSSALINAVDWPRIAADPDVRVRRQAASSLRRVPPTVALPALVELCRRDRDADDPRVPLLLWWALERCVSVHVDDPARVVDPFVDATLARTRMAQLHLLPRLARRLIAADQLDLAARAVRSARDATATRALLDALVDELDARVPSGGLDELGAAIDALPGDGAIQGLRLRAGLHVGSEAARARATRLLSNRTTPEELRIACLTGMARARDPRVLEPALATFEHASSVALREAALDALAAFDDERVARILLRLRAELPDALRDRAIATLARRTAWADRLVDGVESGGIPRAHVSADVVSALRQHPDEPLAGRVASLWPTARPTPADAERRIAELRQLLTRGDGTTGTDAIALGEATFGRLCATCHRFRGTGADLAPDLTGIDRGDLDALLVAVVDPNAGIREGWQDVVAETANGSILFGPLIEEREAAIVVRDLGRGRTVVPRDRLRTVRPSPVSRMPTNLLDGLRDDEIRALFRYLRR